MGAQLAGSRLRQSPEAVWSASSTQVRRYLRTPEATGASVNLSGIDGDGYRFANVGFSSSSGKPGYRGAVNASRPGIYTVDTHYVHESYRDGSATSCFVNVFTAGAAESEDKSIRPGPRFSFDWLRLVKRPVDGLVVSMADGSPLPPSLKQGDEVLFQLLLQEPATDATVSVMTGSSYAPLSVNGAPEVQFEGGERDGREWAARVRLGEGTGRSTRPRRGIRGVCAGGGWCDF